MSDAAPGREVRRCAQCGRAAAVCVKAWSGATSFVGIDLGPTGTIERRDFVCQDCGAGFSLEPPGRRRVAGCLALALPGPLGAVLLLLGLGSAIAERDPGAPVAIVIGVVLLSIAVAVSRWAGSAARAHRLRPIVPGAPLPVVRFPAPEPAARRCRCGGRATSVALIEHQSHGISQGRTTNYRCTSCGRELQLEDGRGIATLALGTVVFLGLGIALLAHSSGQGPGAWVCSGLVTLVGVVAGFLVVAAILAHRAHPPL
jgi:hypothetical protein